MSLLAGLYSPRADRLYPPAADQYVCEDTGGYLKPVYDYKTLAETLEMKEAFIDNNRVGLARFIDLLPVQRPDSLPVLPAGTTPLIKAPFFEDKNIHLKLENYSLSGGSYMRACALMAGMAAENNFRGIVTAVRPGQLPAADLMARSAGLPGIFVGGEKQFEGVCLPEGIFGELIIVEDQNYEQVFELVNELAGENELYNCNSIYNPYGREGYKTIAYELASRGKIPDYVFISSARGNLLSGIYKGFNELETLGWISKIPRLISVEVPPDSYVAAVFRDRNLEGEKKLEDTVRRTVDGFFAREALENSGGEALVVGEKRLKEAERIITSELGLKLDRWGMAALAGYKKIESNISREDKVVVLVDEREAEPTGQNRDRGFQRRVNSRNLNAVVKQVVEEETKN